MSDVIPQLERNRESNNKRIALAERIEKLLSNRDFREVVEKGYFIDAAAQFAYESGDIALSTAQRVDAAELAKAPGHFKRWLKVQLQMADIAERDNKDIQANIDYINSGAAEQE